jgi:head-tail adaptor
MAYYQGGSKSRPRGAGQFDKRVIFDSPSASSDGAGGTTSGWSEEFSTPASYLRLRGGETVLAARLSGNQPTIITVRYSSQTKMVTQSWRGRDANTGEVFNLRAIVPTDDRAYFEITAESGVAV